MDTVNEKIEIFKNNCHQMAQEEADNLKKEIDSEINESIKLEIKKYQEETERNFNKKIDKIEKNYNSELFNQEIECKQNIVEKQKELQEDLKSEIYNRIVNFIDTDNYKEFLFNNVEQVINSCNLNNTQDAINSDIILYLTQKDFDKYKIEIETKFQCTMEVMDSSHLGGAIGETKNILVDNSLKTLIEENIKLVLLGEND